MHTISSGLMEVPVCNLSEPAQSCLLRKVDNVFVEGLKMRLKEDPSGPGVPPLAIVCKDVGKEMFQYRHKDVYQYEVLGGLHGAKARQALLTEHPEETVYAHVHCMVYCGLTDEEALRLASLAYVSMYTEEYWTSLNFCSFHSWLSFVYNEWER